jgi:hypothetical protein
MSIKDPDVTRENNQAVETRELIECEWLRRQAQRQEPYYEQR